ncbi:unnamed protein product [Prorocentrum cordatum]|uniref:Beta-glucosidase n=1 Tax=Prorocentrum cordatum TaxID=2364126 RepID=A0ABN9PI96_9DINO|nr:unnamed protein product [Polarella glacialis]
MQRLQLMLASEEATKDITLQLYNRFEGDPVRLERLLEAMEDRWGFPERVFPLLRNQLSKAQGRRRAIGSQEELGNKRITEEEWVKAFRCWLQVLSRKCADVRVERQASMANAAADEAMARVEAVEEVMVSVDKQFITNVKGVETYGNQFGSVGFVRRGVILVSRQQSGEWRMDGGCGRVQLDPDSLQRAGVQAEAKVVDEAALAAFAGLGFAFRRDQRQSARIGANKFTISYAKTILVDFKGAKNLGGMTGNRVRDHVVAMKGLGGTLLRERADIAELFAIFFASLYVGLGGEGLSADGGERGRQPCGRAPALLGGLSLLLLGVLGSCAALRPSAAGARGAPAAAGFGGRERPISLDSEPELHLVVADPEMQPPESPAEADAPRRAAPHAASRSMAQNESRNLTRILEEDELFENARGLDGELPPCVGLESCPDYPMPYANGEWPTEYRVEGRFPDDFVWGMATAAYQIEGAYREGGRGASIWDTFTGANTVGMPGANCSYCCKKAPCTPHELMAAPGATGNVACDHYHQWKADVALMKSMGLKHYRFSISWPRIFPTGASSGEPNPEGLAFYSDLIDELLAADITPFVTLYHWDLPQALLDPPRKNGWWSRDEDGKPNGEVLPAWLHYVDACFSHFGDRVKTWATFNEAWTFTYLASGLGKAPSIAEFSDMDRDPWIAGHNVLNAHAAAVQLYRAKFYAQGGKIGITNNQDWREPKTDDPEDVAATERSVEFQLGWFSEPIFGGRGDYPPAMRQLYGDRLPQFTDEEKRRINNSADFFGLNHYGTGLGSFEPQAGSNDMSYMKAWQGPMFVKGQSGWLYSAAWGFRKLLNWVSRRYGKDVPIYITEGGWSMSADSTAEGISDRQRLEYYANYTSEMGRAISEDGVNVKGYYAWSLMDNFEWEQGFRERFGTTYNDFAHKPDRHGRPSDKVPTEGRQVRTRKMSSCWLEAVWRSNELVDPDSFGGCVPQGVFAGKFSLPGAAGCEMEINIGPFPDMAYITGSHALDGATGRCAMGAASWGPTPANLSGGTLIADFSTMGLPGNLAGYWNREDRGIHWGDGGVWQATGDSPVLLTDPWAHRSAGSRPGAAGERGSAGRPAPLAAGAALLAALAGALWGSAA